MRIQSKQEFTRGEHEIEVLCMDIPEPHWIPRLVPFIQKVLVYQGYKKWVISCVLCSNTFIAQLNKQFRSQNIPTDVLSFSQDDNPKKYAETQFHAGDIVISLDAIQENSHFFSVTLEEELKRLIIHGILHLAGWEHKDNSPSEPMLCKQEEILQALADEILIDGEPSQNPVTVKEASGNPHKLNAKQQNFRDLGLSNIRLFSVLMKHIRRVMKYDRGHR